MLTETIKSLSDEIIRYISSGGFFYEYGVHRSLMVIIIPLHFKYNCLYSSLCFINSFISEDL